MRVDGRCVSFSNGWISRSMLLFGCVYIGGMGLWSAHQSSPSPRYFLKASFWKELFFFKGKSFTPSYVGVSKNRGTPKWMVYNGKPYLNGWFGGTTIFGNTQFSFFGKLWGVSDLLVESVVLFSFSGPDMIVVLEPPSLVALTIQWFKKESTWKYWQGYTSENSHGNGKSPFWIGNMYLQMVEFPIAIFVTFCALEKPSFGTTQDTSRYCTRCGESRNAEEERLARAEAEEARKQNLKLGPATPEDQNFSEGNGENRLWICIHIRIRMVIHSQARLIWIYI